MRPRVVVSELRFARRRHRSRRLQDRSRIAAIRLFPAEVSYRHPFVMEKDLDRAMEVVTALCRMERALTFTTGDVVVLRAMGKMGRIDMATLRPG